MSSSEEAEWNDDDDAEDDNANGKNHEEEEEDDEGDDEDFEQEEDEEDKKPAAKKVSKPTPKEEDDDDDDSSEDDDIPLSALIKPKKAASSPQKRKSTASKASNGSSAKKKTKATKKKAPPPPPPAAKKKSSSSKSYEYASAALYGTDCDKGLLIQRLLCRWWYAYEWPSAAIRNAKPPPNYDTLDGFPGVFICTKGDEVGKILDTRSREDATRKPSFRNFALQPAEDLRELLLTALEEQQKQLGAADPELSKELKGLVKWATKLNTKKADKDARKILTAHSLVLEGE